MKSIPTTEIDTSDLVWRDMEAEDAQALAALLARVESSDNPPYRTTLGEIRAWLSDEPPWYGIVCEKAGGEIVGFGHLSILSPDSRECICRGAVDVGFRGQGIGGKIVEWEVESGFAMLQAFSPSGKGRISTLVAAGHEDLEQHLGRFGFQWTHTKYELRRPLDLDLPTANPGSYYDVSRWSQEWDDQTRKLYNKLMSVQPGFQSVSPEVWQGNRYAFRPDWSYLALDRTGDRPKLVGFVQVAAYAEDWDALGWKEGYIDFLGVKDFQGATEVTKALLVATMEAQRAAGMDQTATGIGAASNAGALAFYDDLGFERSFESRAYSLEIHPNMDIARFSAEPDPSRR